MVLMGLLIKHINWIKHATKLVAMEAVVIARSSGSNYHAQFHPSSGKKSLGDILRPHTLKKNTFSN